MNLQFQAAPGPPRPLVEQAAACDPVNPFCTAEYAQASAALGLEPYFLGLCRGEQVMSGCIALLSGTFLRRSLLIHSRPSLAAPGIFWRGVRDLCRQLGVWRLQVESFASPPGELPSLPGEIERRTRREYLLDLDADFMKRLESHHRRKLVQAENAGLSLRRSRTASALLRHAQLVEASMKRRRKRGEDVSSDDQERAAALLNSGLGELFQVAAGNEVLSSGVVLRARKGAYYLSAGTSPEGMKLGASPFLVCRTAEVLRQEGVEVFNLGGVAGNNPGLQQFKARFGAREVTLESASFCPKSFLERKMHAALRAGWAWVRGMPRLRRRAD